MQIITATSARIPAHDKTTIQQIVTKQNIILYLSTTNKNKSAIITLYRSF